MARAAAATGRALPRPASFTACPSFCADAPPALRAGSSGPVPCWAITAAICAICCCILASCWARVPFCRTLWRTFSMPSNPSFPVPQGRHRHFRLEKSQLIALLGRLVLRQAGKGGLFLRTHHDVEHRLMTAQLHAAHDSCSWARSTWPEKRTNSLSPLLPVMRKMRSSS